MPDSHLKPSPRSKAPLYWVLAVCVAPTIAAFIAYYGIEWQPNTETTNYGELITAQPAVPVMLSAKTLDGQAFDMKQVFKKWVYVTVDGGACTQVCADRLFNTRQQRAISGRERDRVARLFFVTDDAPIPAALVAAHPDLTIVRASAADLAVFPVQTGQTLTSHIWIVDPLGRVMMRYAPNPDHDKMKRDLSKLLYASKGWQNTTK